MLHDALPLALQRLLDRPRPPRPWRDGQKIPWHDPAFSERVLAVHLDPDTHMASRAPDVIDAHVAWLLELLSAEDPPPAGRRRHVLDLGCGPGLYALALARVGLDVTGIDYAPAPVRHARQAASDAGLDDRVAIVQADLAAAFTDALADRPPADVATFWFAEIHSFTPDQATRLLEQVARTLRPGGLLVLESMPWDLFVQHPGSTWEAHERSVFADSPHLWLQEHHWSDEDRAEITVHWILEAAGGRLERYVQCHQAYSDDDMAALLAAAGFGPPQLHPPITGVDEQFEFPVLVARKE